MIVKKNDKIPDIVSAGLDTVAIRMPASEPARELIRFSGCPVAAPSANISGTVSATKAQYVYDDFKGRIPYIIDGGSCSVGIESTVMDLTCEPPVILRPGGITAEDLAKEGIHAVYHESITENTKEVDRPASPGMKYKHYSPSCEVCLVCGNTYLCQDYILRNASEEDFVIAFSEQKELAKLKNSSVISSVKEPEKASSAIFDDFRKADIVGVKRIFLSSMEETGMGISYMNRVRKSAGGNIKNLSKIIFVCSGNTCRSPIAEYLMRAALPSLDVCSRGIHAANGAKMSFNSEYILESYGIYTKDFTTKQLTAEDIDRADIIYTMTSAHKNIILKEKPEAAGKVFTLKLSGDVSDPFMGGPREYERVFNEILGEIRRITQHG